MNKLFLQTIAVVALAGSSFGVELTHAVHGRISKIDTGAKTVVVRTAGGTAYTFRWAAGTAVHGVEAGAGDMAHGLKEGTEAVIHYTGDGAEKVAVEIDKLGDDGLKRASGTVIRIDHGAKAVVVKSADGAGQTFRLADRAGVESERGVEKGAKVTVYYIADGGKKVAHYFAKQ